MRDEYDFGSEEMQEKLNLLKSAITPKDDGGEEKVKEEIKGSDVDWSEYELDSNYAHFYKHAIFKKAGEEFHWIVPVNEYHSTSKPYFAQGVNKRGEPLALGEYMTWMSNGIENWKLMAVLPNGTGQAGVIFQRVITVILPDPIPLKTEEPTIEITDAELAATEEASINWAEDKNDQQERDGEVSKTE